MKITLSKKSNITDTKSKEGKAKSLKIDPCDITMPNNNRFGKLTVIEYIGKIGQYHQYRCKCDCGNEVIVRRNNLISNNTTSCGCSRDIDDKEIIGKIYGNLKVLNFDHYDPKSHQYFYKCECLLCGNTTVVYKGHITSKTTKSCGCLSNKLNDLEKLIGNKYNNLTIIEYCGKIGNKKKKHTYKCICKCGNVCYADKNSLESGHKKSCGCVRLEVHGTHKMAGTRFYQIYLAMKSRCNNYNNGAYSYYGGRGIKICDRWLGEDGFIHFKEDMYDKYIEHVEKYGEANTTIDRINADGDYCKENCRWATKEEQNNNTRRTIYVNFHYENVALGELISRYSDSDAVYSAIYSRVKRGQDINIVLPKVLSMYNISAPIIIPIIFRKEIIDNSNLIVPFTFRNSSF